MHVPHFISRLSINIKLNALLLVIFLILGITLGLLTKFTVDRLLLDFGQEQLAEETAFLQQHFTDNESTILQSTRLLASTSGLLSAIETENFAQVRRTLQLQADALGIANINIMNRNGESVLSLVQPNASFAENGDQQLLAFGRIGAETSALIPTENGRGLMLAAVTPLKNVVGDVVAVVMAAHAIDSAFMDALDFSRINTHVAFVYNGQLIAADNSRPDEFDDIDDDAADIEQAQLGVTMISDELETDDNGSPDLIAYVPVTVGADYRGVIAVRSEFEPLFAFQRQLGNTIRITIMGVGIAAILFILLFVRFRIVRPLTRLTRVAEQIAKGDLQQRVPAEAGDEIGQLGQAFNTMTDQLSIARKTLENEVIEAQEARAHAERSDQVKSSFLASMSHELRTPLNSVINFTKFVAKGVMGPVNDEQAEALNEAIDSAKHLLSLINDVLDMSKIESGSLKLFVEDNVDLKSILDQVVSTGRVLIEDKPITLELDIDENLPLLRGDRQRILQIMLNIVSNACKFTDDGVIKIHANTQGNEVLLSVQDNGPGIAPEDHAAVFEPFKQTVAGLRQGGGTGLGMPISRSLAEAHGGRLWIKSELGKGATFCAALPIKSESLTPLLMHTGVTQ